MTAPSDTNPKPTPLTDLHREMGARLVDFAGFEMPVQYESIVAEHKHTRSKACVFDICHMGEFLVSGPKAADGLAGLLTHDLSTLAPGKCRYGFMTNDEGGVIDDLIVYRLSNEDYMLVVNGSRVEVDFKRLKEGLPGDVMLDDVSEAMGKIDLQGPESLIVLEDVLGSPWRDLKYFNFMRTEFENGPLLVSRTGYTGELGYEIYLGTERAPTLWEQLLEHEMVKPAGLGARDTLRLEMGLPLYGQDLDEDHTPVEAGYGFMLKSKAPYPGKDRMDIVREKLVPLSMEGRRAARHDDAVLLGDGTEAGRVTSGSFAPSLGHAVALAYVSAEHADNKEFTVRSARAEIPAKRVELPFYKEGTARMRLE